MSLIESASRSNAMPVAVLAVRRVLIQSITRWRSWSANTVLPADHPASFSSRGMLDSRSETAATSGAFWAARLDLLHRARNDFIDLIGDVDQPLRPHPIPQDAGGQDRQFLDGVHGFFSPGGSINCSGLGCQTNSPSWPPSYHRLAIA